MTAKELATLLSSREYMSEITTEEMKQAKDAGLVVVFGYSDDNMELRGAICDEVGCYDGGTAYITKGGVLEEPDCASYMAEDCPHFAAARKAAAPIKAVWHDEGSPCWTYETEIPHETFEVCEDGGLFCVGIVFSLEDLT